MAIWRRLVRVPAGRWSKWFTIAAWLVLVAVFGSLAGKLSGVERNDSAAYVPQHAESVRAVRIQVGANGVDTMPAFVVYVRSTGITSADRAKVAQDRAALSAVAPGRRLPEPTTSPDHGALTLIVPIVLGKDSDQFMRDAKRVRSVAASGAPVGLAVKTGGPAGQLLDTINASSGLNKSLLMITLLIVAVLLLITYRSPLLWILPLLSVGLASQISNGLVYLLARHAGLVVNGQSAIILTVLVFGVGTDYALLLIARYREELRRVADKHEAMATALHRAVPALLASAATVAISLLTLLAGRLGSNRGMGPVGAAGVICAFLAMATLLPAVLVVLGRWVFWPFVPRPGTEHGSSTVWARIGRWISARPRIIWGATTVGLGVMVLGITSLHLGIRSDQNFRGSVESVQATKLVAEHYPSGSTDPVLVFTRPATADTVRQAIAGVDGVAAVQPGGRQGGYALLDAVLTQTPDSKAAERAVVAIRTAAHSVPGSGALVGGTTALKIDMQSAAGYDRRVVIPLVLGVVFVILCLLLRALVAPLVLVGTVVLSFFAALGAAVFGYAKVFDQPGSDDSLILLGFVFLVALGVDYNIFLMTRVREETARHGAREGVRRGLAMTGGVITSAGVVLAATFSILTSMPVVQAFQLGFLVAFGVLLDTFVVRSLLVPALALDLGKTIWWPGRPHREAGGEQSSRPVLDGTRP